MADDDATWLGSPVSDEGGDLPEIQPVFITIDPDRDTNEKLKEYLEGTPRCAACASGSSG